jgi:hypothetical protein
MQAAINELEAKVVIAEQRVARAEEEEGARISPLFKVGGIAKDSCSRDDRILRGVILPQEVQMASVQNHRPHIHAVFLHYFSSFACG